MQIPIMIYGSTNRGTQRGYQLLGQSRSISDRLAGEFARWAPSHGSLQSNELEASSVNFFPIQEDQFIITRTVHGGAEYSGRGGFQVVTIALVLDQEQLAAYGNHPLDVVHTALALGNLILPRSMRKVLHPVVMPRRPFGRKSPTPCSTDTLRVVDEALHLIGAGQRVVVIGAADPLAVVDRMFCSGDVDPAKLSFSTGLKPLSSRDFALQFLSAADHVGLQQLDQRTYTCLQVGSECPVV